MSPLQRSVHQSKLIPTTNGCVSERWTGYEICRFHVRKTALAVAIDSLNCPTDAYRSNRCSIEHYHSICYSVLVWPFDKPFLINATSMIHPPPMQANDKYYHKQTLKRVHHHRNIVVLSTSIFRRINWRMVDVSAILCSGNGKTTTRYNDCRPTNGCSTFWKYPRGRRLSLIWRK